MCHSNGQRLCEEAASRPSYLRRSPVPVSTTEPSQMATAPVSAVALSRRCGSDMGGVCASARPRRRERLRTRGSSQDKLNPTSIPVCRKHRFNGLSHYSDNTFCRFIA